MRLRSPRGTWTSILMLFGGVLAVSAGWAVVGLPSLARAQTQERQQSDRSPEDLRREYQQRYNQVAPGDVQAHYDLAVWLNEQKAYALLLRQARHVLSLDPDHENARLLYGIAVDALKQQTARTQPAAGEAARDNNDGEFLTPLQIQRLKWAEFLDPPLVRSRGLNLPGARDREPVPAEFLQVRFDRKVRTEFLDLMSGHPDFDSRDDRTAFLELPPTRQVQLIRQHTGDRFQKRIRIVNDPLVFQRFEQRVLPIVTDGCGSMMCHGGPEAEGWRLRTSRSRTDLNLYTNWLILNRARRGNQRLVNRAKPLDSLVLQYGLPLNQSTYQHPDDIPVAFPQGRQDPRYRRILAWIEMLEVPEPRTDVSLPGYPPPPAPRFGGDGQPQPDEDDKPEAEEKPAPPNGN